MKSLLIEIGKDFFGEFLTMFSYYTLARVLSTTNTPQIFTLFRLIAFR